MFGLPRWAVYGLAAILLLGALAGGVWAIHRDGYKDGKSAERAVWEEAERKLLKKSGEAATKADKQAAARAAEHAATVADERKKIDEAVANGSSPFDAIFGN